MSLRPVAQVLAALLGGGLLAGCQDSSEVVEGVYHPTLIEVSPDLFLGDVPCKNVAGAMRSYVATVYDLEFDPDGNYQGDTLGVAGANGDGDGSAPIGFALPSSAPLACTQAVAFARVVEPHRYRAEILGFEQAPGALTPLGLGVPLMVDPVTNERVSPRWRIRCGDQSPAKALSFYSTKVRDCRLESDAGSGAPVGPTQVRVTLGEAALGKLECGTGSGQVDHFELEQSDGTTLSAPCGETLTLTDVAPNARFSADVLVYEGGRTEPRWGTLCSASPSPGLSVDATCAPLDDHGALDIDPASALGALGSDCAALGDLPGELALTLVGEDGNNVLPTRYINGATCARSTRFAGLVSGAASVRGTLRNGPTELGTVLCTGTVIPGRATPATCTTEP